MADEPDQKSKLQELIALWPDPAMKADLQQHFDKYKFPPPEIAAPLEAHARWVKTEGREGAQLASSMLPATLTGFCFDGYTTNLRGAGLDGIRFVECSFTGVDFRGASLNCVFERCDLSAAFFDREALRHAKYNDCALDGASWDDPSHGLTLVCHPQNE